MYGKMRTFSKREKWSYRAFGYIDYPYLRDEVWSGHSLIIFDIYDNHYNTIIFHSWTKLSFSHHNHHYTSCHSENMYETGCFTKFGCLFPRYVISNGQKHIWVNINKKCVVSNASQKLCGRTSMGNTRSKTKASQLNIICRHFEIRSDRIRSDQICSGK